MAYHVRHFIHGRSLTMKRSRALRLAIPAAILAWLAAAHVIETRRIAVPMPAAASEPAPRLAGDALVEDVRVLAAPDMEGRKTGSAGNRKARALLEARFRAIGLQPFGGGYAQPFSFTRRSIRGLFSADGKFETHYGDAANIIGWLPGTAEPGRYMVISAHYDHLGVRGGKLHPGADDNASGVAALLAMAAWFRAHPPRHSIIFAAFDAEEMGVRGAKAFFDALPVPKEAIALNLNLDMISSSARGEIFASGLHHYPFLRPHVEQAAALHTVRVLTGHDRPMPLAGLVENWTGSSDHRVFHEAGIPYLYFGVEDHPDYHAPTDTFERLNRAFLARSANLILEVAIGLDRDLAAIARKARG